LPDFTINAGVKVGDFFSLGNDELKCYHDEHHSINIMETSHLIKELRRVD